MSIAVRKFVPSFVQSAHKPVYVSPAVRQNAQGWAVRRGGAVAGTGAQPQQPARRVEVKTHSAPAGGEVPGHLDAAGLADAQTLKPTSQPTSVNLCGVDLPIATHARDADAVPPPTPVDWTLTPSLVEPTRDLAKCHVANMPVLLVGATGVGKTFAVRQLAAQTRSEYMRINLSDSTDVDDLLGRYVGNTRQHTPDNLAERSDAKLRAIARDLGLSGEGEREAVCERILREQEQVRWVDGPVLKAMRRGAVLLLDEINLAKPGVIEGINGLLDRGQLLNRPGVRIEAHPGFRMYATMNPSTYEGRKDISPALASRWLQLVWPSLPAEELLAIIERRYADRGLPMAPFARLILAHHALAAQAEEGRIGHDRGGVAYTLRDLCKVAERFLRYAPRNPQLTPEALLAREVRSVYVAGLADADDQRLVLDELRRALPEVNQDFTQGLALLPTAIGARIGDVDIVNHKSGHPFVPSTDVVMTPTSARMFYEVCKAVDMGENVGLLGERASGKSLTAEKYAEERGLPFYPEHFDDGMDGVRLIGSDSLQGWTDGILVHAMRHGGVLLADEFNLAPAEILERLNSLLDEERVLVLSEKESERVEAHRDFVFIATLNPPRYAGRNKMSRAMLNRLTCLHVPTLESAEDMQPIIDHKLLHRHLVPNSVNAAVAGALLGVHAWTTQQFRDGLLGRDLSRQQMPDFSLRQVLHVIRLTVPFTPKEGVVQAVSDALRMCYGQHGSDEDRAAIGRKIATSMQAIEAAVDAADPNDLPQAEAAAALVETATASECGRTLIRADRSVYHGDIVDGRPHGFGTEVFLDGSEYEGQFENGERHGRGVLKMAGRVYTGDFVRGVQEGEGHLLFVKNGDYYQGSFKAGTFDGKGVYVYASGRYFDGEFARGRPVVGNTYNRDGERRYYAGSERAWYTLGNTPEVLDGFDMGLDVWVANAPLELQNNYRRAAAAIRACKYETNEHVSLDISGLHLESLPSELGDLSNLRTLNASGNRLIHLPHELSRLSQLESLDLNHNEITDLPAFLGQMPHLSTVNLSHNLLTAVPTPLIVQPNLRSVDLRQNAIAIVPPAFWEKTSLTHLWLDHNRVHCLPSDLSRLRRLMTLSLSHNQIRELPASMVQLEELETLNVESNDIETLPADLTGLKKLQELRVMGNRVRMLPRSVSKLPLRILSVDALVGVLPRDLEHQYHLRQVIVPPRKKGGVGWVRDATFEESLPGMVREKLIWSDGV